MTRKETDVPVTVRGKEYLVPIEALVCENCGFVELEPKETAEIMRRAADCYRQDHGYLTSTELRARRQRLGMTQKDFADWLKVGVASVKRWEMGQIQDECMDELIRLKTDPEVAEETARKVRELTSAQAPKLLWREPWRFQTTTQGVPVIPERTPAQPHVQQSRQAEYCYIA
jgi:putative zinc finger/helix-turn-helix protein, YgiT family